MAVDATADAVDLDLQPNEASDLAIVPDGLVDRYDRTFVTVLDEGVIESSIAVLGHTGDDLSGGWDAIRLRFSPVDHGGRTEDAEACDFHDGRLYVLGSHYGSKDGPLEAKRAWLARVGEEDLAAAIEGEQPPIEIARNRFALHRALNDRLRESGVDLRPVGPRVRRKLVEKTVKIGEQKGKRWAGRVREGDQPVNIEGMCFLDDGRLLLGLRLPVTAEGGPVVVELLDVEAFFAEPEAPPALGEVWTLHPPGASDDPVGIRALHHAADGRVHAIVGSLDALGKKSAVVTDDERAGRAHCEHWAFALPDDAAGGPVDCEPLHDFPGERSVEGLAQLPGGEFLYVVDRDQNVHLRFLLVEER